MRADERFRNLISGKNIDRLPMIEWVGWWDQTLARWKNDGLVCREDLSYPFLVRDVQLFFGLDACIQYWISAHSQDAPKPLSHGAGIMKTRKDYEKIKGTLYPDPVKVVRKSYIDWINETRDEGNTMHWFTLEGYFWFARTLFGIEGHLYSFYDEPELLKEICHDHTEWMKKVIEYIGNSVRFDFMTFGEDMSYNHGPMLSKELFDEFLYPFYKEIIPVLKKLDIPIFLDSDGDITLAVDWYASVGIEGMLPLERQAGVDVSEYLKKQPNMFFLGHFDKMCMKHGEESMRREFERLLPSMKTGRFIPSVDHQTPPDVSLENYQIYVKLFKEYTSKVNRG
jgi:hypothetical protein